MSLKIWLMRRLWAMGDAKRDQGLTEPQDVEGRFDLAYGPDEANRLGVYWPKGAEAALPTIVSVHGGGYFYGSKELYRFYCMDLARRGFAVVNFSYRLSPEHKFPAPVQDTNQVMEWVCAHAGEYPIDLNNVFILGDSAGAQLTSQYAAMWSNPAYADTMGLRVPAFQLRAVGLNCGMYDLPKKLFEKGFAPGLLRGYLPQNLTPGDKRLDVLGHITAQYPPTYLFSSSCDFLLNDCAPMAHLLQEKGIETQHKIYGQPGDKKAGHVFHLNLQLPLATQANDEEIAFFKAHMQ